MTTRIAIGSLMQETNTFVPMKTTMRTFSSNLLLFDHDIVRELSGTQIEIAGFLDILNEASIEIVPTIVANAVAGGPLRRDTFDNLVDELISRLKAAQSLDGVILALHGAMVIEDHPDAESLLLKAVRDTVGKNVPIVATLDLHGHLTPEMLSYADLLVGYQEYPHIDMYETGIRAARFLLDMLEKRINPTMAMTKCPMVVSPVGARTDNMPLKSIVLAGQKIKQDGEIIHCAMFPVQPWLDVPNLGFAVLVVTNNDTNGAQESADKLAEMAWSLRHAFEPDLVTLEDAINGAHGLSSGLIVVGDAGDAPTGGSAADNATVLRTLLQHAIDKAERLTMLTLCDAEAAQIAHSAGKDAEVSLTVGHKVSEGKPLSIKGKVSKLTDGTYRASGAGYGGTLIHMGLSAVISIGTIRLCLRSRPSTEWDTGIYTSMDLDLNQAALVFVKSPSHFRATYSPLATHILVADTPGPTCPNMRKLQFNHVTRPLYPLDEL